MKTNYAISIPKPCHEDWSKMTPNEKGRFCQACSKTVVDFTSMSNQSVSKHLRENKDKNVCGRFKTSQLKQIRIAIPKEIISQQIPFHKLFLLALLITMGTSLLSCLDQKGNTQKIESVQIVDTSKTEAINLPEFLNLKLATDSVKMNKKNKKPIKTIEAPIPILTGLVIEVTGDDMVEIEPSDIDQITLKEENIELEENSVVGQIVGDMAEFKNTPASLSQSEKRRYLNGQISKIVSENFNITIPKKLGLKGKQRLFTQFKIDEQGYVKNIKVRKASHLELEKEAIRVINLLPQFIPAKQGVKNVAAIYTLPITFIVED